MDEISVTMTLVYTGPEEGLDYLREAIEQIPDGRAYVLTTTDN